MLLVQSRLIEGAMDETWKLDLKNNVMACYVQLPDIQENKRESQSVIDRITSEYCIIIMYNSIWIRMNIYTLVREFFFSNSLYLIFFLFLN